MDRPVYGMMTNPSADIVKEIRLADSMGFDYVELSMEIPEGHFETLNRKREIILKGLRKFSHPPVAHTAYWSDLWSDYSEVRKAWTEVLKTTMDAAALLGCRVFNVHAPIPYGMYSHSGSCMKRVIRNFSSSLKEMVSYASGREVTVVLENIPNPGGRGMDEYKKIINSVPDLKPHLDIGHLFLEGGMRCISDYLKTFGERIGHLHFSDNLGLSDDHMGIGQGLIDYFTVMGHLRRIGYSRTITLEVFSSRKELRDSLRILRAIQEDIWPG